MVGLPDFTDLIEATWADGVGSSSLVKTYLARFDPEPSASRDLVQMADELLALSIALAERVRVEEISRQSMIRAILARFPLLSEGGLRSVMQHALTAVEREAGSWGK